ERQPHRRMTHDRLQALGRPAEILDEHAGGGMAQLMKTVFRLSVIADKPALDLQWRPTRFVDAVGSSDAARAIRKNILAAGALQFPLPERIEHDRGEGNVTRTGL